MLFGEEHAALRGDPRALDELCDRLEFHLAGLLDWFNDTYVGRAAVGKAAAVLGARQPWPAAPLRPVRGTVDAHAGPDFADKQAACRGIVAYYRAKFALAAWLLQTRGRAACADIRDVIMTNLGAFLERERHSLSSAERSELLRRAAALNYRVLRFYQDLDALMEDIARRDIGYDALMARYSEAVGTIARDRAACCSAVAPLQAFAWWAGPVEGEDRYPLYYNLANGAVATALPPVSPLEATPPPLRCTGPQYTAQGVRDEVESALGALLQTEAASPTETARAVAAQPERTYGVYAMPSRPGLFALRTSPPLSRVQTPDLLEELRDPACRAARLPDTPGTFDCIAERDLPAARRALDALDYLPAPPSYRVLATHGMPDHRDILTSPPLRVESGVPEVIGLAALARPACAASFPPPSSVPGLFHCIAQRDVPAAAALLETLGYVRE